MIWVRYVVALGCALATSGILATVVFETFPVPPTSLRVIGVLSRVGFSTALMFVAAIAIGDRSVGVLLFGATCGVWGCTSWLSWLERRRQAAAEEARAWRR